MKNFMIYYWRCGQIDWNNEMHLDFWFLMALPHPRTEFRETIDAFMSFQPMSSNN